MVERLKVAIEKARERRSQLGEGLPSVPQRQETQGATPAHWDTLPEMTLDEDLLKRNRIVTYRRSHAAHSAFDVLRTRLIKTCRERNWSRIAITSPTKGCGKSVVCANLAFSIARHQDARAILVDLDLRAPEIGHLIGDREKRRISRFLSAEVSIDHALQRIGRNLAVASNATGEHDASEILQSARTAETLHLMIEALKPDLVIYDLPPLLVVDDVIGFLPNVDGVLLVAAAGHTRAREIADCERLLADQTNFLGVVLNKYVGDLPSAYGYDYAVSDPDPAPQSAPST